MNKYIKIYKQNIHIIYQDKSIIIINKINNTIIEGHISKKYILFNILIINKLLKYIPRCGIIHRLDKEISGIMIIAKTITSYIFLISQQQAGLITKLYDSIIQKKIINGGFVCAAINKTNFYICKSQITKNGKKSITYYKLIFNAKKYSYIKILITTGRTHQIRLHMKYINYFIYNEKIYNNIKENQRYKLKIFNNPALHAIQISFKHPYNKKIIHFFGNLTYNFNNFLIYLKLKKK